MKRSASVTLGGLAVVAAGLCTWGLVEPNQPDPEDADYTQVCGLEQTLIRTEDAECEDDDDHDGAHWFYGGSSHRAPAVGQPLNSSHFTTTKPSGVSIAKVSRGGFGGRVTGSGS